MLLYDYTIILSCCTISYYILLGVGLVDDEAKADAEPDDANLHTCYIHIYLYI